MKKKNIVAFSLMLSLLIVPANAARTTDDVYNSLNYANQSAAYYLYRAERALDQANLHLNNIFTYFSTLLLRLDNYHVDLKSWLTYNNLGIGSWLYNIFSVESSVNNKLEQFVGDFQPVQVPVGYEQLEYLTGGEAINAYFTSHIIPSGQFGVEIDGIGSSAYRVWSCVFGVRQGDSSQSDRLFLGAVFHPLEDTFDLTLYAGTSYLRSYTTSLKDFPFHLSYRDLDCSTISKPIGIFHENNGRDWSSVISVKYLKFYDHNSCVCYYVPCRRLSDGIVGFYDLVGQSFYSSTGSGNFIPGPVKASWANTVINRLDTIIRDLEPQLDPELQSAVTDSVDGARGLQRGFGSVTSGVFGQMGSVGGTISDTFSGSGEGSAWSLYDVPYELMDPGGG